MDNTECEKISINSLEPSLRIEREENYGKGVALSIRKLIQEHVTHAQGLSKYILDSMSQEDLRKIKNEIEIFIDIEESKETIIFCMAKEEEEESTDNEMTIFDITINLSHIRDSMNHTRFTMKNHYDSTIKQNQDL